MVIAILADGPQREELNKKNTDPDKVVWVDSIRSLGIVEADGYIDLQYRHDPERTGLLRRLTGPVMINAVADTCPTVGGPFARINAWPGFLEMPVQEIVLPPSGETDGGYHHSWKELLDFLGWKYRVVADTPGMITARIISMIINEAWFAFGDGVSSKKEIDTAMKLGTNYPYGPFEWTEKIGADKIRELLERLNREGIRYEIAPALLNES